ncbi:DUF3999 family protein, partial [Dyella sp.]|uniref:DUF3999 family protein n=1 Tax=Dyella sp. TaxID=1869338 RepID=UPI002ED5918B
DHTNEQAGGSAKPTQWLIDAGRSAGVDTINVAPESIKQDFDIHVQVDSSDDLKTWSPRGDIQSLTRVSSTKDDDGGGDHVEQLSLSVAGDQPARYYRVRLVDGDVDWRAGQTPAVRLEGSYVLASADPLASLQWMNVPVDGSPKRGNDFDYKLSAPLPLESARLVLPAGNVAAHITVSLGTLESDGKLAWSSVGSVDAVRVKGSNEPTSLQWTMQTTQYLRVHADTALANAPALQVGWMPETYMFMAEGQGPYRLLAGSYEATRGSYPIAASLEKLRKAKGDDHWLPPVAAVGNRVDEAGPGALKPPKVPYDWTRPVLWVVLILGALLIAGMAWSLLKSPRDTQPGA